jgi:hypothetical protein
MRIQSRINGTTDELNTVPNNETAVNESNDDRRGKEGTDKQGEKRLQQVEDSNKLVEDEAAGRTEQSELEAEHNSFLSKIEIAVIRNSNCTLSNAH